MFSFNDAAAAIVVVFLLFLPVLVKLLVARINIEPILELKLLF
jgi:hypothetical protein